MRKRSERGMILGICAISCALVVGLAHTASGSAPHVGGADDKPSSMTRAGLFGTGTDEPDACETRALPDDGARDATQQSSGWESAAQSPELFVMPPDAQYKPEVVLVSVDRGMDVAILNEALSKVEGVEAAQVTAEEVASGLVCVELSEGTSVEEAVNELRMQGAVADAQPNYRYVLMEDLEDTEADGTAATEPTPATPDEVPGEVDGSTLPDDGPDGTEQNAPTGEVRDDVRDGEQTSDEAAYGSTASGSEDAFVAKEESVSEHAEDPAVAQSDAAAEEETDNHGPLEAAAISNDSFVSGQWGLEDLDVEHAWQLATCDHKVTIASLDLGLDIGHEDLKGNIVVPYNAHNAGTGGNVSDVSPVGGVNYNHGTHVAGILAAVPNNKVGVAGVSYNAQVMPIKVVDSSGNAYTSDLVRAYDYVLSKAFQYNVRVINISMGSAGSIKKDDAFLKKVDEAYDKGIVTVAAAGNRSAASGWNPPYECYPGDYEKVVSVISLQKTSSGLSRADGSNYNDANERDKNISAPGVGILSTVPNNQYGSNTGTSMAAPHVSGVLALEFAANPNLSASQAVSILYETATDIGPAGWDANFGWGEVNAYKAVSKAKGGVPSKWRRLAGPNRYDTMGAVVDTGFASSGYAILATGANFPDALSASALAGARACPVILTTSDALCDQAAAKLKKLKVSNVYVMGGAQSVSSEVERTVRELGIAVTRIAGSNRQDTSVEAFKVLRSVYSGSDAVIIATGSNFADSLSIGPWSYVTRTPILLATGEGLLTDAEVQAIRSDAGIRRVIIMGGDAVVRDQIKSQLGDGYAYVRLAGANRYATSRATAAWATSQGLSWTTPAVSTGANFPDALAGAALCGKNKSPLLLVSNPSSETISLLRDSKAAVGSGYVLGGESAVSRDVATAVEQATS